MHRPSSVQHSSEVSAPERLQDQPSPPRSVSLPFAVRIARTDDQLKKAIALRSEAYGRHVPDLGNTLKSLERLDLSPDSVVILAESKVTSEVVGTMRIQTNFHAPIAFETTVRLPESHTRRPLATVSRLAVKAGPQGRFVKLALFKSLYQYCMAKQVQRIVIGARPPLDRHYLALGFQDIFSSTMLFPLPTADNLPHRLLSFDVMSAERRWHQMAHPLYRFMLQRFHPDIEIFNSVSNRHATSRRSREHSLLDHPHLDFPLI